MQKREISREPDRTATALPQDREFVLLLTPDKLLRRRLHAQSFAHYLAAVDAAVRDFSAGKLSTAFDLQVEVLLRPNGVPIVNVQMSGMDDSMEDELHQLKLLVAGTPYPVVTGGCVGLVIRHCVRGGGKCEPAFASFFSGTPDLDEKQVEGLVSEAQGAMIPRAELDQYYFEKPATRRKGMKGLLAWMTGHRPTSQLLERFDPDEPLYYPVRSPDAAEQVRSQFGDPPNLARINPGTLAEYYHHTGEPEKAATQFSKLVDSAPLDERTWLARALFRLDTGDSGAALSDLDRALSLNPAFGFARYRRAIIYASLGATGKALDETADLIASQPHNTPARMLRLQILMTEGQQEKAAEEVESLLQYDPHWPEAIACWAWLKRQSMPGRAVDLEHLGNEIKRGLRLAPLYPALHMEHIYLLSIKGNWTDVLRACDNLIESVGDTSQVRAMRGLAYYDAREHQESIADCEFVLEQEPDNFFVRLLRGKNLAATGELDRALADADLVLEQAPEHIDALMFKGEVCLVHQQESESLSCFAKVVTLVPQLAAAHGGNGRALARMKRFEEAAGAFRRAIELDPRQAGSHFFLGLCLRQLKDYPAALESLNRSDQLEPGVPQVMWERARLLGDLNSSGESVAVLDQLLQIEPDFPQAIEYRAWLHERNRNFELAEQDWDRLVRMYPDFGGGFLRRGMMWEFAGNRSLATREFEQAEKLNPEKADEIRVQQELAQAHFHFQASRFEDAIGILTRLIGRNPSCLPAWKLRGTACWYDERFVEAIDYYTQVLNLSGGSALDALSARGQVYAELGEFELAVTDLNQVINAPGEAVQPNLIGYSLSGRGYARWGMGDAEGAIQDFREAIKICPENGWLHYNLGRMHLGQNRRVDAAACFERALHSGLPPLTAKQRVKAEAFLKSCRDYNG